MQQRRVVPPTKTASLSRRGARSGARDRTIRRVKALGRRRWKKASGDHQQARVENAFFRYTSIVGDCLRARSSSGQRREAVLACNVLNRMTELGRPVSYRIGRCRARRFEARRPARIRAPTPRFVLANDVDTEAFAFTTRPRTHLKRAAGRKGIPKVPRFAGPSHWPAGYSRWHSVRENTNRLHVVPRHTTLKLCCTNSCSLNARPRHHRCRLIWTRPNAKDTEARILVTTGPRIHPKFAAVRKGISKCTPFPALSHWLASHARDHSFS